MKKNLTALFLTLSFFVLTGYARNYKHTYALSFPWQSGETFKSAEGRFSAVLPAGSVKFKYEKLTKTTSLGTIDLHQYGADNGKNSFIVAYYDLPEASFAGRGAAKMLEDGRDGALRGKTLVKEEKITVDNYPGLELLVNIPGGSKTFYLRSVFVVAKPRIYNYLFVTEDKTDLDKRGVKNFFSSFHIQK